MEKREGWGWPTLAKKAHYFRNGHSLCGRWGGLRLDLQEETYALPDDCAPCRRKLDKEKS